MSARTWLLCAVSVVLWTWPAHAADDVTMFDAWRTGDTATGNWGGARTWLDDHGVHVDVVYAVEGFSNATRLVHGDDANTLLGHLDAALTLNSDKLGLWHGAQLYALVQNGVGRGINDVTGSSSAISNLEAEPYTQLSELFVEQQIKEGVLRFRIGKQDANRDFGTPRFGGNFINNGFGMLPTVPLPSYPTTGLGAFGALQLASFVDVKAGLYERNPAVENLGLTTAFAPDAGYTAIVASDVTHTWGDTRDGGTTSVGVWAQAGDVDSVGLAVPKVFHDNAGLFVQDDERLYAEPSTSATSAAGITFIVRAAFAEPDRNNTSRYVGGSLAWHGLLGRDDDTVGLGSGWFNVTEPLSGHARPGSEFFVEGFYKLRLTSFFSVQPDVEFYHHPGGDGPDALLCGLRVKVKL
jgi:porin